jgi:hypothetical protein
MPFLEAKRLIRDQFMLALEAAPFDPNDPQLVEPAGACGPCRHRTGNQVDLFGDIVSHGAGADVCTYPPCFEGKRLASAERELDLVRAQGLPVLSMEEAAKALTEDGPRYGGGYVDADGTSWETNGKTWRVALGKKAPPEIVGVDPLGNVWRLYEHKAASRVLNEKSDRAHARKAAAVSPKQNDWRRNRDIFDRVVVAAKETIEASAAAVAARDQDAMLRLILLGLCGERYDGKDTAQMMGALVSYALHEGLGDIARGACDDDMDQMKQEIETMFGLSFAALNDAATIAVDEKLAAEVAAAAPAKKSRKKKAEA